MGDVIDLDQYRKPKLNWPHDCGDEFCPYCRPAGERSFVGLAAEHKCKRCGAEAGLPCYPGCAGELESVCLCGTEECDD